MDDLVSRIRQAFSTRPHPGADNIARCGYDKKNGGTYDGPCWECQDMTDYFGHRSWPEVPARELRRHGSADAQFEVDAYCYFLPGFLVAAINSPAELDVCVNHIVYRFGPKPDDDWGQNRLAAVTSNLSGVELQALLDYLRYTRAREHDFDGYCTRAIQNIERVLAARSNSSSSGREEA